MFISAAEPSADAHAANLIRAVRTRDPLTCFAGVAGPRMADAGCEVLFDMTRHSAMLLGAIGAAGRALAMFRACNRFLQSRSPAAAVVVDSPTLHLPLVDRLRRHGVPILYYIAPQLWAWGAYRIHKLRDRVDRLAVILPFEEEYFRNQGVPAVYVGHPLAEAIESCQLDAAAVDALRARGAPVVALLPGSRKHVVAEVLRGQLEVAERVAAQMPGAAFLVSVANPQVAPTVEAQLARCRTHVATLRGEPAALIRAADLALVASGTAALEVAFHGRPMIVMYNASPWFYHLLGRWMLRTRYLSLPNILAEREVVPEFMPYYRSTVPIAERALELLRSQEARQRMVADLETVVAPLRGRRPSDRTAELLLELIGPRRHSV